MTFLSGNSNEIDHDFRSCIPFLTLMAGIFFINFFSRIILAPLMPSLERDLNFSHLEAGSLFLCASAGYFFSLLSAGFISSRITHKHTICLSCMALGIANLWISLSGSLNTLRVGMFMIGLASGIYLPSAITTLTSIVRTRHWGKALSIHELAPNLALIAAPLIAEAFLAWMTWRSVMIATGLISLCLAAVISKSGKKGNFKSQKMSLSSLRELLSIPSFWIIIVLHSLAVSSVLGIYTMLPLYLVSDLNIDQNTANTWIA
ncbi:MAG: MFS transporter, partial [Desulfoplanes sp.]